ncbi:MAG: hypothetical protein R2734_06105 [Nocardioides sp.]
MARSVLASGAGHVGQRRRRGVAATAAIAEAAGAELWPQAPRQPAPGPRLLHALQRSIGNRACAEVVSGRVGVRRPPPWPDRRPGQLAVQRQATPGPGWVAQLADRLNTQHRSWRPPTTGSAAGPRGAKPLLGRASGSWWRGRTRAPRARCSPTVGSPMRSWSPR